MTLTYQFYFFRPEETYRISIFEYLTGKDLHKYIRFVSIAYTPTTNSKFKLDFKSFKITVLYE